MKYKFSVVIPSYNDLSLLIRAMDSVRMQKNIAWELIVVDDSNTDAIESYMSSLKEENIRYVHNRQPLGAVKNWNFGLSKVDGEYVVLLHHDEAFTSDFHLWNIVKVMDKGADVVVAHTEVFANGSLYKRTSPGICNSVFLHFPALLFLTNQIGPCASVAFKNENIEIFDERLHWLVDVEWYYRMLRDKRVCVLDGKSFILSMHNHAGQITRSMDVKKVLDDDIKVLDSIYKNKFSIKILLKINRFVRNSSRIRAFVHKLFYCL